MPETPRKPTRKCPICGSANLYQEIVEDFLSDEKVNNFRCRNCKHEWSEEVTP